MRQAPSASAKLDRLRRAAPWAYRALLIAGSAAVALWSVGSVWPFTIDDAGISYAYAKHIAEGFGPVAAPGGPWVEGYSNPLWVALLVPFHWLGVPLPIAAKLLGVGLLVVTIVAGVVCLRPSDERRWYAIGASDALFAVVLTACLEWVIWIVAGLENALFSALLLLLAALQREAASSRMARRVSGLVAFALCITRPEGALYAVAWVALELVDAMARVKRTSSNGERSRKAAATRLNALSGITFLVAPLVVYHALHYWVFRQLLPNTYLAKPVSREWQAGIHYLTSQLNESGLVFALPLAAIGVFRDVRSKLLLLGACLAGSAFVLYSGGDWMPHGRFLALFAPALTVLAVHGVANVAAVVSRVALGRIHRELVLLSLALPLAIAWGVHQWPRLRGVARHPWCHFCERLAESNRLEKLSRRLGLPAVSVVTHDFGGPAWSSSPANYPIDFLGLCDRSIALIRRDRKLLGGSIADELRLYQYLMHEQPVPPSWLYLPTNFWKRLDRSPEFRSGYLRLPKGVLPGVAPDTIVGLHRAELVDYFPPVERFEFRPVDARLTLLGWKAFTAGAPGAEQTGPREVLPGAHVRVLVSLLPRKVLDGAERLTLRIEGGGQRIESPARPLVSVEGFARQLGTGEPIAIEFELTLPAAAAQTFGVSLGVFRAKGAQQLPEQAHADVSWTLLGELAAGARLPQDTRVLPRFPNALPSVRQPDLAGYQARVARISEERRRAGDQTLNDEDLSEALRVLAERLEAGGQLEQAYLSYVWSTQASRLRWRELADPIFRLRPALVEGDRAVGLELLRAYYSTGEASALSRWLAFCVTMGSLTEIEYFLERAAPYRPPAALQLAIESVGRAMKTSATGAAEAASLSEIVHDPLGTLDFETASLEGWQGELDVFRAGAEPEHTRRAALRGQQGHGLMSSLGGGKAARGRLQSPEFTLDGTWLSLLVAGTSRRAGVELVVNGEVVATAHGNNSDALYPQLWDVSKYQGQQAHLIVFDENARGYVLLDRVLSWK